MHALQAFQVGAEAAKMVTSAFPDEMELKYERMCLPFMLLHVNRYGLVGDMQCCAHSCA